MLQFETHYHIYNHANGSENLFREKKNYAYFLKKYHHYINPIADTLAWCLMPNHFHLLVKIKEEKEITKNVKTFSKVSNFGKGLGFKANSPEDFEKRNKAKSLFLSKQFANFFSSYTQSYNKVYKRRGSLFLKNFKRKEIKDENYLRNLIFYIHLNPVKHQFVKAPNDWLYSSYLVFPKKEKELLTTLFDGEQNYYYNHQIKVNSFREYENLEQELT